MNSPSRPGRAALAAALALALALAALPACDALPDEAWLRIVSVEDASGAPLSVLETWLREEDSTESANLRVENATGTVGVAGGGIGIRIRRIRVETYAAGVVFPVQETPATLYLPSPGAGADSATTISVAVFPPTLKRWVLDNVSVPDAGLDGAARVTVYALTDEGRDLETSAGFGLRIVDGSKPVAP